MAQRQLAVQLYTLRDLVAKDFAGTLKQVAKLGYEGVELAGLGNSASPQKAAAALLAAGLKVCGAHVGIEALESDLKGTLATYRMLGCQNIIVPWLPEDRRKDAKGWKAFAKSLDKFGKIVKKEGFRLGYHNHSFEFALIPGTKKLGMDILMDETDPDAVSFELDCFWVVHGGKCPACFILEHGRRLMTLHLKDMSDPFERKFANVGTGLLDIPAIVAAGTKVKVPWFIVEQDDCYGQNPMEAVKISRKNLRQMKLF
jgi:sugar phosphate isomerase/epimerase